VAPSRCRVADHAWKQGRPKRQDQGNGPVAIHKKGLRKGGGEGGNVSLLIPGEFFIVSGRS